MGSRKLACYNGPDLYVILICTKTICGDVIWFQDVMSMWTEPINPCVTYDLRLEVNVKHPIWLVLTLWYDVM